MPIAILFVSLFHQYFFRTTSVILYQYCSVKTVCKMNIIFVFGPITSKCIVQFFVPLLYVAMLRQWISV